MKFKNSYLLLIAMAIFLLVSIGSVCASENITTDNNNPLATSDSDVVLADGDNADEDITTDKINTTVTTDKTSYTFKSDDDKNISVTVKDNNSEEISGVNKSNLSVFEGNKTLNFTYNNKIISIIDKLAVGNHSITINYLGNASYANSTTTIQLSILGNNTLESPDTITKTDAGEQYKIPNVRVFNGVNYITIDVNNFKLNLTYIDNDGKEKSIEITELNYINETLTFNTDKRVKKVILNYTGAVNTKTIAVLYGTSIKAENETKIKDTEDKNITVEVFDNKNQKLNVTIKVLENGKDVSFTYKNDTLTINNLATGVHNLTIIYSGNETYAPSNKTIIVKVWGNQTINPQKTAILDKDGNVEILLNLTDGADPVNINKDNLTVTVFYKIGNAVYNKTISGFEVNNQIIKFKFNETFDTAYAEFKYIAENNLTGRTDLKLNTTITTNVTNIVIADGKNINFTCEVKLLNETVIPITAELIKILNKNSEVKFTYNNTVITLTDKLKTGVYNLTVKYLGTETYGACETNITISVYGINATTSANINSTKKGEIKLNIINGTEIVDITVDDLKLNVTYKSGNETKVISIQNPAYTNGTLSFTLDSGNFTTATLNVKYEDTEFNITLNRVYNAKIEVINNENPYRSGNFTFRLVDIDDNSNITGKSVSLYTVGSGQVKSGYTATTDSNGIASFKTANLYIFDQSSGTLNMKELTVGTYTAEVKMADGVKDVTVTTVNTNLTIRKAAIKIEMEPYKEYYGADKNVTFKVTNDFSEPMTGIVLKLTIDGIDGTYYISTDSNGKAHIAIYNKESKNGLVGGDYKFTASNNDTENIENTTTTDTVTVVKIPSKITAASTTVYYNTGTTTTIKVTDSKTGKALAGVYVLVTIDGNSKKTYLIQTNSKGQIALSASLDVGKHKLTVQCADNRYSAKDVTATITVKKASAKLTAKKVTAYYKGGKYFTIKLTNTKNKKPIYDAKVNIKIFISKTKYYNYNGNTGMNGKIKLLLDSLKPGTYNVVISGASSKNFNAKQITSKIVIKKAPTKFTAKKLTAKKGKNTNFKVTVKNSKTKKVIPSVKVKVKVYTGKKSKTYTIKSNSKGIAKLNVKNLKVGSHKVVIKSGNKYCVAKKAKSTIKIKK